MSSYYETTQYPSFLSTQIPIQAKRLYPDYISVKLLPFGYYYQVKPQELKLYKKIKAAIFISRVV